MSILSIPAITTAFHTIIVAAIITATAPFLFDAPLPVNWAAFALIAMLAAFVSAGLGSLIGVISSNTRITVLWSQLIYLPSMMLGGAMVPMTLLPQSLSRIGLLLAPTYAMQAFQGLAMKQEALVDPMWSVVILLAGGILAFALAIYLFAWDSRAIGRGRPQALAALALVPYVIGAILLL